MKMFQREYRTKQRKGEMNEKIFQRDKLKKYEK